MTSDEVELLKRRLTDEVQKEVQSRLFRTYAFAGAAAILAFGYANWDFVEDTKTEVKANAKLSIEKAIEESTAELDDLKALATRQAGFLQSERERADRLTLQVQNRLQSLGAEAESIAELTEAVAALSDARRDLEISIGEVSSRTVGLSVVADELKVIAERLQNLDGQNAPTYNSVINKIDAVQVRTAAQAEKTTVYLHFAGGSRERAERLSRILMEDGYLMPGEQRLNGAAGKREVRYFHEEDKARAERLAGDLSLALEEIDAPSEKNVKISDFTGYGGKKNRAGIIEVWVEI